jgi:hypothetical protein
MVPESGFLVIPNIGDAELVAARAVLGVSSEIWVFSDLRGPDLNAHAA